MSSSGGGLSLSHISPRMPIAVQKRHHNPPTVARYGGQIEYTPHGNAFAVKRKHNGTRKGGGSREGKGNKGRTSKSRKRAQDKLDRIDTRVLPLLVTLTYPDAFPTAPEVWKQHLDKFARRMARHFPESAFFWVVDLQKRKSGENAGHYAPHYHLLVWGVGLDAFHGWMPFAWYEVTGKIDRAQIDVHRHRDSCQAARSANAVKGYVAKYVTKADAGAYDDAYPDGIGGWWGIRGRKNVPWAESRMIEVTERGAVKAVRLARKYVNAQYRAAGKRRRMRHGLPHGVSVSVINPETWARVVIEMGWGVQQGKPPEQRGLRTSGYLP